MASSRSHLAAFALMLGVAFPAMASAQQQTEGLAVERFYPSSAGGGWFVMDELNMHGGFGGAIELTTGYAHNPLVVASGGRTLTVVSDEAFADLSAAVTWNRFRLSLDLTSPLALYGFSGTVGGFQFTGPRVNPGTNPDTIADPRIGFDARILGNADSPFRLGASAQLIVPSGSTADYDTDGTVRAMFRLLFAGGSSRLEYAGQVGVHVRPRDDPSVPGGPRGSELLFGLAGGPRFAIGGKWSLVLGPEVFGEQALNPGLLGNASGVEGLLSARIEGAGAGPQLRVKLGAGGGIDPQFGAPQWRVVAAVELFSGQP